MLPRHNFYVNEATQAPKTGAILLIIPFHVLTTAACVPIYGMNHRLESGIAQNHVIIFRRYL